MADTDWFGSFKKSEEYTFLQKKPLAYFCIEYALSDEIPSYAGGLGVLAGDYVKELYAQQIPAVAVGLYYHSRYGIDNLGSKNDGGAILLTPQQQQLEQVLDKEGKPIRIKVPIYDKQIYATAWKWQKDTIPVFLLDTNIPENNHDDQLICYKLYDSNKEIRLKQEILLGIGGYRLLEKLGLEPALYHMNEGHSAFLVYEVIRKEMQEKKTGFLEAQKLASQQIAFTNHTLLAAGNEIYSTELFTLMLDKYAGEIEVPMSNMVCLGQVPQSNTFSLSLFCLHMAGKINAVSQLHASEAKKTWINFPVETVTNGIFLKNWDRISTPDSIAQEHRQNKQKLLTYIKDHTGMIWQENDFIIGWARRVVRYKRPLALFGEIKDFADLARNRERPVRIVMAGIAHQGDIEGREILQVLQEIIKKELPDIAVFLPDYKTELAKLMTAGSDIWLNTPVVGFEACGTSGMKAALNGTLACTTRDGWIAEIDLEKIGWEINNDVVHESVIHVLRDKILPLYYGDQPSWIKMMLSARDLIRSDFSTSRMLKDYIKKIYMSAINTHS